MHAEDDGAAMALRTGLVEAEEPLREPPEELHLLRVRLEREERRLESSRTRWRWWRCVMSERSAATRRARMIGVKMKIVSRTHPR